jgi:hypothetical protein
MNQRISVLLNVMVRRIGKIVHLEYGGTMLATCCGVRANVNRVFYLFHAQRVFMSRRRLTRKSFGRSTNLILAEACLLASI